MTAAVSHFDASAEVIPIRPDVDPGAIVFSRGDQVEIADAVLEALGPAPLTYDAGEFWSYLPDLGIWDIVPGHYVRHTSASFAGCDVGFGKGKRLLKISASISAGVEAVARDRMLSSPDRVRFDDAPHGMAFRNGFVTVADGRIRTIPHAPENRARHAYPFDYTPDAPCPNLDRFMAQLFADVDQFERDLRIALLQEFIGACLVGDSTRYQRYMVLYATGGNGKSELLRIARGIFPKGSVTSLPPHQWGDRFKGIILEGKRANFVDELPDGEIMSGHSVKQIVTGEPITAERKNRDPVEFVPIAGHIMAANSPIRSADQSEGFWRRPLVLPLTRRFDESPDRILSAGTKVLESELPAVVAWAIAGAERAQAQGGYTMPPSSGAILVEWRDESDQIRGFASEQPDVEKVRAEDLYDRYKDWAKRNGIAQMSSTMFGRRVVSAALYSRSREAMGRCYTRVQKA